MGEINFLRWRRHFALLSGLLLLCSLASLAVRGISYGLDFTGGVSVELEFTDSANLPAVRAALASADMATAQVSHFGADNLVVIRLPPLATSNSEVESDAEAPARVLQALGAAGIEGAQVRRSESVGPRIGAELRERGGLAVLVALFGILLYITFRFQPKFAVAAVAALVHDVLLVLGLFSAFGLDFDLAVLAAILALIGYSLNDTIVVSDRIRESFRRLRGRDSEGVINTSLNLTLARTLVTSLTTLLVLGCLLAFGGGALRGFSLALCFGVVIGTYSSVYIVPLVLLQLRITAADLIVPEREEGAAN